MRSTKRQLHFVGLCLALGIGLGGCDSDLPPPTPLQRDGGGGGTSDGAVQTNPACTQAIKAKIQLLTTSGGYTQGKIDSWKIDDWSKMVSANPKAGEKAAKDGKGKYWEGADSMRGKYWDDLDAHPGCKPRAIYDGNVDIFNSAAWLGTNEVQVPEGFQANSAQDKTGLLTGYKCAAKIYKPRVAGIDDKLPIIVLQHGNSGSPNHFEEYGQKKLAGIQAQSGGFTYTIDKTPRKMLASQLIARGYQVIAADLRPDVIMTLDGVNLKADPKHQEYGDAAGSIDHGWGTPILQDLLKKLFQNTTKQVSLLGHSYGYSVIRDALRRIYLEYRAGKYEINPYTRLDDVILMSGTAHGVNGGNKACAYYVTLRGSCNCQMGDRDNYTPTEFNKRLNGPSDLFSAPCADGSYAFGKWDRCEGHVVDYTTITMKDLPGGKFQDEFVSEGCSKLNLDRCVDNQLISTTSGYDSSGFFLGGKLLANHLGTIRSQEGIDLILKVLSAK